VLLDWIPSSVAQREAMRSANPTNVCHHISNIAEQSIHTVTHCSHTGHIPGRDDVSVEAGFVSEQITYVSRERHIPGVDVACRHSPTALLRYIHQPNLDSIVSEWGRV
jgi:hypothetical protein